MAMERIWDKILPLLLPQNYRLITFDWPFAGTVKDQNLYDPVKYSSVEGFADDLITLLNKMDLKAVTFVGHSMSGMIGCIASVKSPQLFKTLILVGASPNDYEGGFNSSDIEQLLSNRETNYENFASGFASLIADPTNEVSVNKYEKEILDKVETPCTIIQTKKDAAVPHNVALYMENKIKGKVTLEIIDTLGHFPQLTAHLKFVEVLKGALAS
ncbi:Sigma factor sigB regulation protein rsbQ [Glycine soja]|nr:Sigma factor sigB regulation protein rsbQ [Glycine soja]